MTRKEEREAFKKTLKGMTQTQTKAFMDAYNKKKGNSKYTET